MKALRPFRFACLLFLTAVPAFAQTTITAINPNNGPNQSSVIAGTGFSTATKGTRFVDENNIEIFSSVSCSSATSCDVYPRPGLVQAGQIQTFKIYSLVNGVKSGSFINYYYYGAPIVSSVSPSSAPTRSGVGGITITGQGFTSNATGFPGTTSLYLYTNINDRTNGCSSTTQCTGFTAPALDCCATNGVYNIDIRTPGGAVLAPFTYVTAPATPTITSVSPSSGSRDGGYTVTIQGTGFSTAANKTTFTMETSGMFGGGGQLTNVACASTTMCTGTMPGGSGKGDLRVAVTSSASPAASSAQSANTAGDDFNYSGIIVTAPTQPYTTEAGDSFQFKVRLNTQPTGNVTTNFAVNGFPGEASVSPTSVVFTNADWNTEKTITVTGLDDAAVDGNRGISITTTATSTDPLYNNAFGADVSATNLDNENANIYISPVDGLVTNEAGGTAQFKVRVLKAPTSNIVMTLTSSDPTEGTVSPSTITFTPADFATLRTVTVTGVSDAIADGTMPYAIVTRISTSDAAYSTMYTADVNVSNQEGGVVVVGSGIKGDFNGDSKSDIVLRNYTSGQNAVWLMNGTSLSSVVDLPALANVNYRIEGTADFNADGKADIVLRNYSTGQNALWIMNGTALTTVVDLPALPNTAYHIEGTGDFNADNKPDIILRNYTTGQNAIWLMNGTSVSTVVDLPALPNTAYKIESAGDFNADGKPDIVLRNGTTGQNALWLMNGTSLVTIVDLPALPNVAYRFDGVADMNADTKPDIILRNYTTGQNAVWLMNGTALSTIVDLPALPNTQYEINGPR